MTRPSLTDDALICGGGLAGATLALQLKRALPEARVTLVDERSGPAPEGTHKVGESFVELASWHLRENLGLEAHLREAQLPKLGLRFFMRRSDGSPFGSRLEYGVFPRVGAPERRLALPTFNVDRGRLENHLLERAAAEGVAIRLGTKVQSFVLGEPHTITLRDAGGALEPRRARFVVDATGHRGLLKRQLGLAEPIAHEADASWIRVSGRLDVEDWCDAPGWRARLGPGLRWMSTNHLVGDGYWVWLIPLASGGTSVGLVTDPRRHRAPGRRGELLAFLRAHEPELAGSITPERIRDHRVRRGGAFGCSRMISADGWAIVGDAGFFLDPLYSPGADFVAIQGCLVTALVTAQLAGANLAGPAAFAERLLQQMFDQHLLLYRGVWDVMADPLVMATKVAWDTAAYFAFNLLLFQHGLLTDAAAMSRLRAETERIGQLQRRAQALFRRSARPGRQAQGWVDQFAPDFLYALYRRSEPGFGEDGVGEDGPTTLRGNLAMLEEALRGIDAALSDGQPPTDVARLWTEAVSR